MKTSKHAPFVADPRTEPWVRPVRGVHARETDWSAR